MTKQNTQHSALHFVALIATIVMLIGSSGAAFAVQNPVWERYILDDPISEIIIPLPNGGENTTAAQCAANGFDFPIAKWGWNQTQFDREEGDFFGFLTNVTGTAVEANWTSSPAAAGIIVQAGNATEIRAGGEGNTEIGILYVNPGQQENLHDISFLIFCGNEPEEPPEDVNPIFECWEPDPQNHGQYIAHFGWENYAEENVTAPHESGYNTVTPASFESSFPEEFPYPAPDHPEGREGRTAFYPNTAINIDNWNGSNIVWHLTDQGTATAGLDGPRCPFPDEPVKPILECTEYDGENYTAFWGYTNQNDENVTIPIGEDNKFTGGGLIGQDQGQPELFEPGRTPYYPAAAFSTVFDGTPLTWTLTDLAGATRTSTASDNPAQYCDPQEDVKPVLECVEELDEGLYRAHFGYLNQNSYYVNVPVGDENKFTGGGLVGQDQGQPTTFMPGRTEYYPNASFSVDFDGTNLVWTLMGRTSTASDNPEQACPTPEPVRPILECVLERGPENYTAYFGYLNENDGNVSIPIGEDNKFTGTSSIDAGQPELFMPGRTSYYPNASFSVDFDGTNIVWTLTGPDESTRTSTASANGPVCEPACGNGVVEEDEACDDGNTESGDGCSATCEVETQPFCGDGTIDEGEACDDGELNGVVPEPGYAENATYCTKTCELATVEGGFCGDEIVNGLEECDEGGLNGVACTPAYGDLCTYCAASCEEAVEIGGSCGDGVINGEEVCDEGFANGEVPLVGYGEQAAYCTAQCVPETVNGGFCGDGIVNGLEECDGEAGVGAGEVCTAACELVGDQFSCEEAVRQGLLTATINGNQATVVNNDGVDHLVTLASYEQYSGNVFDQMLYDTDSEFVGDNNTTVLEVAVPACNYQIDVICGVAYPTNPAYFEDQKLASEFGNTDEPYCVPDATGGAALFIQESYPQASDYVLTCDGIGFEPVGYDWYFGDGQHLVNSTHATVFHRYLQDGDYTAACTASDGEHRETATIGLGVVDAPVAAVTDLAVTVEHGYPQDGAYSFMCQTDGFTPEAYDWRIVRSATGETVYAQIDVNASAIYHEFAFNGDHEVYCGASDAMGVYHEDLLMVDVTTVPPALEVSVADSYPQGAHHSFVCDATGFEPTMYDWEIYSMDSEQLVAKWYDVATHEVFHTFTSGGDYLVSCSAEEDGTYVTGWTDVTVPVLEAPVTENTTPANTTIENVTLPAELADGNASNDLVVLSSSGNSHGGQNLFVEDPCAYFPWIDMCQVEPAPEVRTIDLNLSLLSAEVGAEPVDKEQESDEVPVLSASGIDMGGWELFALGASLVALAGTGLVIRLRRTHGSVFRH